MTGILVHEWLAARGGSENVFEVLSETFPDAERWCLWNDSEGRFTDVNETWLARTPLRRSKPLAVPFMPAAWRSLPARDADWVLCSSHAFAHQAKFKGPAGNAPKLVYAHTPARYVWDTEADDRGSGIPARLVSGWLRPGDRARAQEPTAIAANSGYVASRIARVWDREADVIYPPVDTKRYATPQLLAESDRHALESLPEGFLLGASRFVPYKRLDAAIVAGEATGLPVVLAGGGPDEARLRELADQSSAHVTFVTDPSLSLLSALYAAARAYVFAPVEDFGIMPVEAMAAGTPVLVNAHGGAAESVVDGVTGTHLREWSAAEIREAMSTIDRIDATACIERAREFDTDAFIARTRAWVEAHTA